MLTGPPPGPLVFPSFLLLSAVDLCFPLYCPEVELRLRRSKSSQKGWEPPLSFWTNAVLGLGELLIVRASCQLLGTCACFGTEVDSGDLEAFFSLLLVSFSTILFICLFLAVLGLCCCMGFPLVVMIRGYSLVAVQGCLTAVAPLIAELGSRTQVQ